MDTQKKTPFARERDREDVKAKRAAFIEGQAELDPTRLIFLDESGFRLGAPPHYGWAVRGEKSPGKSVQGSADAIHMIRTAGAEVLFLPPYSPEYNPIERAWSKMKEMMRRMDTLTREAFDAAVAVAMAAISLDDIRAWTQFAGYELSAN